MKYDGCPGCGRKRKTQMDRAGIYQCVNCGAIYGNCYLGDSYSIVKPMFDPQSEVIEQRYFDLTCLGSEGISRRHGWYNPKTRLLIQVG